MIQILRRIGRIILWPLSLLSMIFSPFEATNNILALTEDTVDSVERKRKKSAPSKEKE
jgi:hypothetical protein